MPALRSKSAKRRSRPPLTRERVLQAALALVDREGAEALSMRAVASQLGVEAMSLYRYVASKEDLLLGVADLVVAQIEVPRPGTRWREAMRARALSAREVFLRHPAAALLVESCARLTPARLAYADAIVGLLMADGFDAMQAYRAFLLLDSYVYGFTLQELGWPRPPSAGEPPFQAEVPHRQYPHFAAAVSTAMARAHARGPEPSYADEFRFGLERVLDALEPARHPTATVRRAERADGFID